MFFVVDNKVSLKFADFWKTGFKYKIYDFSFRLFISDI